ncbi:restriction endonuclease subunit S [Marinobacter zhejiangensis]|uniref:Type I restriction enzyme, S subunit n=1 Tax=Marinobacter zhejiangensis TaxID=488535 RepID=A0A1I4T0X8_9GAMM|nr:restriction endonuclease subunit S [Marinobacter zhejiangensis]SFM70311.1 type I restriction enzyme, S subunit [Marinobacter zhejiangensis]
MGSEWLEVPFEDLLSEPVRNGIYKKKEFHGSGAKIVNMGELFGFPRLFDVPMKRVELTENEIKKATLKAGDLLFARRSLTAEGAGKCSIVKEIKECTTFESSIIRARPDQAKALSEYLYYFFLSPRGRHLIGSILRQVAVAGITGADLKKLPIVVPPLGEQAAIAQVLGSLEDKITLNRQINTTLESMAQALFKSWFVDFDPVIDNALAAGNPIPDPLQARAQARAALGDQRQPLPESIRNQFPDRFVFTEALGWVPEGWGVEPIGNLIELAYGKSLPATKRIEGSVPVYGSGGLSGYHNASLVQGPSIIVGRKGTVGSLYWVEEDCFPIDTVFHVANKSHLPLHWVFQALKLVDIKSMGADSAVPGVNRNVVYATKLVVPPEEALGHYSNQVEAIFARCKALRDESSALGSLRDTLLPKLLSGELRVPEAERQVAEVL